jgi:uncharacterized protein (TIGR03067 family)
VQIDVRLDEVVLRALEKKPELRYQQVSEVKTIVETIVATPRAADESAPTSDSPPKVSRCYVSTPEHLHSLQGRLLYNFQAKGELRLARETLTFHSGWPAVTIPLSSVRTLALGTYPVSIIKPMSVNYMAVTFAEHGGSRTLLFTPTLRFTLVRPLVMSPSQAEKTMETSKLAMEWVFALREAYRACTGQTLPVSHSEAKTPSKWDRAKAYLQAAAAFAIPFAMLLLIFEGALPNPFSELLPSPITAAFAAFHSLPGIVRVAVWIAIYSIAWGLFMALVRRGSRKRIIAFANSLPPHADDNSWLAIVDGGDYVRSWQTAAASFQSTISKEEWVARLERVRRPLGKVISRKLRSLKHTAARTRQEVEFDTSFDGLPAAVETVTFAVQPNGGWKVIGYLIRPREIAKPHQSWWTWSPLQSREVGEICSHLTKAEQNNLSVLGLVSSAWIVGTCFGIPAFIHSNLGSGKWIVALVWVILFAVSIPMLERMVRHFLCSTTWARERGFAPEQLRLFSFSGGNVWRLCAFLAVGLALIFAQSKLFTHLSGSSELSASLKEDAARTTELSAQLRARAKSLQGTWSPPDIEASGTGWPSLVVQGSNLDFRGMNTNYWFKASFSLLEDTNPKQLVAVITESADPKDVGKTANAIYEIQDGKLIITVNEPGDPAVPAGFDAPGADKFVFKYKANGPHAPLL